MFRRSKKTHPEWKVRLDSARAQLKDSPAGDDGMISQIDTVELEVERASKAQAELAGALEGLEPDRIEAELKSALRVRSQLADTSDGHDDHDRLVRSLQRRRETMHELRDRSERLDLMINTAVADVENLVAQQVELASLAPTMRAEVLAEQVDHLRVDLDSLRAAHAELDDL